MPLPPPPPLVTGSRAFEHAKYLERRSISPFAAVPVPAVRFVPSPPHYAYFFGVAAHRITGHCEQNVNKVNTKATVRCALDSTWIPSWARDGIRESVG